MPTSDRYRTPEAAMAAIRERNENTMGTYRGNGISITKGVHVLTDAEWDRNYLLGVLDDMKRILDHVAA